MAIANQNGVIYCSGAFACLDSHLSSSKSDDNNSTVYCGYYASCFNTTVDNVGTYICTSPAGCGSTTINHVKELHFYLLPLSRHGDIDIKSDGIDMDIYFWGVGGFVDEFITRITCSNVDDICTVYCDTNNSWYNVTVDCYGLCYIQCLSWELMELNDFDIGTITIQVNTSSSSMVTTSMAPSIYPTREPHLTTTDAIESTIGIANTPPNVTINTTNVLDMLTTDYQPWMTTTDGESTGVDIDINSTESPESLETTNGGSSGSQKGVGVEEIVEIIVIILAVLISVVMVVIIVIRFRNQHQLEPKTGEQSYMSGMSGMMSNHIVSTVALAAQDSVVPGDDGDVESTLPATMHKRQLTREEGQLHTTQGLEAGIDQCMQTNDVLLVDNVDLDEDINNVNADEIIDDDNSESMDSREGSLLFENGKDKLTEGDLHTRNGTKRHNRHTDTGMGAKPTTGLVDDN